MKVLVEYGCRGYETTEEMDIDITEEQYLRYIEDGFLPEDIDEEIMESVYEVSDLFYNVKKI